MSPNGSEQTRLMDRLFNDPTRKLLNFSITPGEQRCTAEELCAEINSAMDQVDSGRARRVEASEIDGNLEVAA